MQPSADETIPVTKRVTFVHNQYNSPLALYSTDQVAETLSRHARLLEDPTDGIDLELVNRAQPDRSEVFKMVTEQEERDGPDQQIIDMKRVAWPPVPNAVASAQDEDHQVTSNRPSSPKRNRLQNSSGEEERTTGMPNEKREPFASNELVGERVLVAKPPPPAGLVLVGRPLKSKSPFRQEPKPIYTESYFKRGTTPVRMLGDMVWPPKGAAGVTEKTEINGPPKSPGPVRRQQKDYRGFFGQHQLPPNFPTYRAPPGTQHFGLVEGENSTPM